MAGRGIRLGKVLGIQISIDYTWFIVFVLFAWSLSYGYFPYRVPGLGTGVYIFMGVISSLLLFVCVLAHELSHSYTANRLGMGIQEITLFIFGGVAKLTREPDEPVMELKIALAGPAASLVLAAVFWAGASVVDEARFPVLDSILGYLALINTVLLAFNMIPGFPLDGGRVFRAVWWLRTGDMQRATRVASNIGKGFAIFLIVMGFMQMFVGNVIGGLWFVLIGVFVQQAAESGYQQVALKYALQGMKVGDLMSRSVITVSEARTVSEAVEEYFFRYHHTSYPVTSNGHVAGLLTLNNVRSLDKDKWDRTSVAEVMQRLGPEDSLQPEDSAMDALGRMAGGNTGRLPVLKNGELVGILSRRDIMKMLEFRAGLKA